MQTIRAKVHKGCIEPIDPITPLEEGKEVIVLVPEAEKGLPPDRRALLERIDAFRNWYGPLGCSVKELIREGRRDG